MPETSSSDSLESPIEQVVAALGKYYGAISRSDFVSLLLMREQGLQDTTNAFEVPDSSPGRLAARALLDLTDGGYTTPELIKRLSGYVGESGDDSNDIPGLIKICYEPELVPPTDDKSKLVLRPDNRPKIGNVEQGKIAGSPAPDSFSIRKVAGITASTSEADGAEMSINTGSPANGSPDVSFSVVQVFANRLSPASRDMGALTLFMNAIPTIEINRAVPFIDVTLIQKGDNFSADNRIQNLSLGQFLLGNAQVDPDSLERTILGAKDQIALNEEQRSPSFRENRDGSVVISPISTAGMEIFTSPQTLVNANEDFVELADTMVSGDSDAAAALEEQLRRQSPVIDKFRPLASLKSLSFDVVGAGGMMSYKSGKMSLVVHDRSRLAEVSALISPSRLGSTHLMIEYGWSHPDAPIHRGLGPVNSDNLFGSLIGALRVKEKYQVVNTSYSFDEAGQVNIDITLSMLATRALQHAQIGLGLESSPEFNQLKHLTDMIETLRSRISPTTARAVFGENDIIGSLTNPAGATASLSPDVIRQIRRVINSTSGNQNADLRQLGQSLADLIGSSGSESGARGRLRNVVNRKINQKIRELRAGSDPFFIEERRTGNNIRSSEYVSLGKIFSSFLAEPICVSSHFKDVQIIFYNFNDKASYMANRNIATFPVKVSDFQETLKRELDQIVNMPVESFANFMGTYFISDSGAEAYGFSGLYDNRDNDSQRQLRKTYEEDSGALFNEQQRVLQGAYRRAPGTELEFKQPTVTIVMESIPVRGAGQSNQTALRMHVIDAQATAHTTVQALLEAASSKTIGLVNSAAVNAQQELNRTTDPDGNARSAEADAFKETLQQAIRQGILEAYPTEPGRETPGGDNDGNRQRYRIKGGFPALKNFMMKTVPSVRYGQGSSGILSANVTSMSDPTLTTISIQRQGTSPDTPTTVREQGLPLDVSPVECNLETIGCPLWSYGQQIFLDFGTGTTIDSMYNVTGVTHTIEPGNFKTSVKLVQLGSYARYKSLISNVENALVAINQMIDGDPIAVPQTPRRSGSGRRSGASGGSGGGGATEPLDPFTVITNVIYGAAAEEELELVNAAVANNAAQEQEARAREQSEAQWRDFVAQTQRERGIDPDAARAERERAASEAAAERERAAASFARSRG